MRLANLAGLVQINQTSFVNCRGRPTLDLKNTVWPEMKVPTAM